MARAKYKGIRSYKMNTENTKNIIKRQIFIGTGRTDPLELRPRKKKTKVYINNGKHIGLFKRAFIK